MGMGKRILVVDDSSVMRKLITETLEAQGHRIVGSATNGNDAIALYDSVKPDLVTMDITMKGIDGFAAAKEILHHDANAQIIFLSNLMDEKIREDAMDLGARGFVNKNEPAKILECINRL